MSSRSLNEILIKIPTELFNFIFAAYNLRFILPRVVCLHLYAKGRCTQNSTTLFYLNFTVLYSQFQHCTKDVSKVTAQRSILEFCIYTQHNISMYYRTQSAIWVIRLNKYGPNSRVTDILLSERQRLKDDHLSMSLRFFSLPMGIRPNDRGPPF